MIEAKKISLNMGDKPILRDVNLVCEKASVTALIGCNGAGKTSVLRILAGLLCPSFGHVYFEERSVSSFSARELAEQRAVLAQNTQSEFPYSVAEIVAMGQAHQSPNFALNTQNQDIERCLRRVGLDIDPQRDVRHLSGGEHQLALLARVLHQNTPWVFLDEPSNHLDIPHQARVSKVIELLAQEGRGVIVATHDLSLLRRSARHVYGLKKGEICLNAEIKEALQIENIQNLYDIDEESARHHFRD